jgi:hypothetical protein
MQAHAGKHEGSSTNDVLPVGTGPLRINSYDLLFAYTDPPTRGGYREVFASLNGMDINETCTFVGCATSDYKYNTNPERQLVSMTMSGTVTIKCTSFLPFSAGDLVAWKIPRYNDNGDDRRVLAPDSALSASTGRLLPVLYPIRPQNPGSAVRILQREMKGISTMLRRAVQESGGTILIHTLLITQLRSQDTRSSIVDHLDRVLRREAALHVDGTFRVFERDMMPLLNELWTSGFNPDTAYRMVALIYMTTTAVVKLSLTADGKDIRIVDHTGEPAPDQMEAAVFLEANLLSSLITTIQNIMNFDDNRQQHHIIGKCMRPCAAGMDDLDVWLGRVH